MQEHVKVEELTVSRTEREAGIAGLLAVTFKRLTLVIAESVDGYVTTGRNVPWPRQEYDAALGVTLARQGAVGSMAQVRATQNARARRIGNGEPVRS